MGYKRVPNACGIYKITCLGNGKVYIGQSSNLNRRKTGHFYNLKRKEHKNGYLQNAWNKYNPNQFIFEILEYCSVDRLNNQEKFWIDFYEAINSKKGFNISSDTEYALRGQDRSKFRKKFKFLDPMGLIVETNNLPQYCKDNNLPYGSVLRGLNKKNSYIQFAGGYRKYKLISPTDEIVNVDNLKIFAQDNGLSISALYAVVSGFNKQTRGWRKYKDDLVKEK